jgi:RHS repeat-associated protein
MNMPNRNYQQTTTSSYRYGFNGKEKANEITNDDYDYDARIYDGRLGRWLSVDPAFSKSPSFSPYSYCFNNPIIYTDPDGEYPLIVISDQVSGYTFAHVYGVGGKTTTVIVKTYKMIVYDVNAKGKRKQLAEFYVTRDGWYNNGETTTVKKEAVAGGKTKTTTTTEDLLVNRTSEPKKDVTLSATPTHDYADTKGAYALGTVESEPIPNSWNTGVNGEAVPATVKRSSPDKANGVMIHIGGYFTKGGANNLAGYYGCYGIVDPTQVYATYGDAEANIGSYSAIETTGTAPTGATSSNNQMNKLVNTVQSAAALAAKRKEKDASQTKVNIKKRAAGSYKKQVKVKTGSTSVTN